MNLEILWKLALMLLLAVGFAVPITWLLDWLQHHE